MSGTIIGGLNEVMQARFNFDNLLYHFSINVQEHAVKKNRRPIYTNRATGKPFIGKSRRLIGAEDIMLASIRIQANAQKITAPIDEPIWMVAHFYFPEDVYYTQKGTISRTLPDLSNLYELPQDSLQKAGVITNDTLIHSHDLSRRLKGTQYRLDLFLLKFDILT